MAYSKFPYALINKWVLDDLADHNVMASTITYNGKEYPAMMPGREIPEVVNATIDTKRQKSFIVYSVDNDEPQMDQYKTCEGLTYVIWGPTVDSVSSIAYCIKDLTDRLDWSVFDLNHWIIETGQTTPFIFLNMTFEQISGPTPVKQEAGRHAMIVSISYDFANSGEWAPNSVGQGRQL